MIGIRLCGTFCILPYNFAGPMSKYHYQLFRRPYYTQLQRSYSFYPEFGVSASCAFFCLGLCDTRLHSPDVATLSRTQSPKP